MPKILIVTPYAPVAPHFETELELAERHIESGDQVVWLACNGGLANCDFNPHRLEHKCRECVLRREHGGSMLTRRIERLPLLNVETDTTLLSQLRTAEDLKSIHVGSFDIGYAVLSSLVSAVRDPDPDPVEHLELIRNLYASAYSTWDNTLRYVSEHKVDRVYVFNGRFASMRAVFRACQQLGVDCVIHERGATKDQFELYPNHLPHDIEQIERTIRGTWHASHDTKARDQIAREWFQNRRERVEKNWVSFTKGQTSGRLPIDWEPGRRNIAIFTSSDDEFVSIGDQWRPTLFESQLAGIDFICQHLKSTSPSTHIYLRMHPNQIGCENETKRRMLALAYSNLTTLAPEDPVDTYTMMGHATQVVSFGSSVGIEAAFWKRPSILLGPCFYQHLGSVHCPQTPEEVLSILTGEPGLLPDEGALMYGYWMNSHGMAFRHFEAESWYHGRFKGEVIYARQPRLNPWQKLKSLVSRSENRRRRAS